MGLTVDSNLRQTMGRFHALLSKFRWFTQLRVRLVGVETVFVVITDGTNTEAQSPSTFSGYSVIYEPRKTRE